MAEISRELAGHIFVAFVPAQSCRSCGETYFAAESVRSFELHVALQLVDAGISTGDAFRFMRKAIRMPAAGLASLLDVAPETVSRWETQKRATNRGAAAILGALVRDAVEGRRVTIATLKALQKPRALGKTVRVEIHRVGGG